MKKAGKAVPRGFTIRPTRQISLSKIHRGNTDKLNPQQGLTPGLEPHFYSRWAGQGHIVILQHLAASSTPTEHLSPPPIEPFRNGVIDLDELESCCLGLKFIQSKEILWCQTTAKGPGEAT